MANHKEFTNKVVLVTGAQQGIGRATAIAFAAAGAQVSINWHDDAGKADAVHEEVRSLGAPAALVKGDVGIFADCRRIVEETVACFGQIDVLVNNAGMFPRVAFLDMQERDYDFVMNINQKGTFFCSQAAAQAMIASGTRGCIVNLSSQSIRGQGSRASHYIASKLAIVGITRASAHELAPHGIRVNAVAPGLTDTAQPRYGSSEEELAEMARQVPLGRMLQPAEISDLVLFLCSERARMVTGQVYHVNGGSYFA